MTPTCWPKPSSAAARLTVSDDLPTPPLPLATAITRVAGSSEIDFSGRAAAKLRRQRRLLVRAHHVEPQLDALHAGHAADVLGDLILERVPQRAAGDRERDRDGDIAPFDLDRADHVELGHGLAQLGVDHALERAQHLVAVNGHRGSVAAPPLPDEPEDDQVPRRIAVRPRHRHRSPCIVVETGAAHDREVVELPVEKRAADDDLPLRQRVRPAAAS